MWGISSLVEFDFDSDMHLPLTLQITIYQLWYEIEYNEICAINKE